MQVSGMQMFYTFHMYHMFPTFHCVAELFVSESSRHVSLANQSSQKVSSMEPLCTPIITRPANLLSKPLLHISTRFSGVWLPVVQHNRTLVRARLQHPKPQSVRVGNLICKCFQYIATSPDCYERKRALFLKRKGAEHSTEQGRQQIVILLSNFLQILPFNL